MVEYRLKSPRPHSVPKRVNTQSLGITEEKILYFFFHKSYEPITERPSVASNKTTRRCISDHPQRISLEFVWVYFGEKP